MPPGTEDREELTRGECEELLDSRSLGRVALSIASLPTVVPVRYARDGGRIVLSVRSDERVARAADEAVLAFQVDDHDAAGWWSVLVRGRAVLHAASDPEVTVDSPSVPSGSRRTPFEYVSLQADLVEGLRWPNSGARARDIRP